MTGTGRTSVDVEKEEKSEGRNKCDAFLTDKFSLDMRNVSLSRQTSFNILFFYNRAEKSRAEKRILRIMKEKTIKVNKK